MASKNGKIITVTSTKGGVGKTTTVLNLAGIYHTMDLKTLIIDLDLYSGGIALSLDIKNKKDIFMMIDGVSHNRFTEFNDYVDKYNENIDVLSCPKDPRQANKLDIKYISLILEKAKQFYDVILIDTNHVFDEVNVTAMDYSFMTLLILTNDPVDLKNMKSIVNIFKDANILNYSIVLNNARDTGKDYLTLFDIKNIIKTNIDYTIYRDFYIKNIDKYILDGEILTLNKSIVRSHKSDVKKLKMIAEDLLKGKEEKGDK